MKKLIALIVSIAILVSFIVYDINADVNAIKNIKLKINGAWIGKITFEYIVINVSTEFINNESRNIKGLNGNFVIYILNNSVGNAKFEKINIEKHSFYETNFSIKIYYKDIAIGIINAIEEGNYNLCIKGRVTGKIFFGIFRYSQNIYTIWK